MASGEPRTAPRSGSRSAEAEGGAMLGLVGGADSSRGLVPVERLDGAPERIDSPEPGAQSVAVEPGWACWCSALTLSLNGAAGDPLSGRVRSPASGARAVLMRGETSAAGRALRS